MMTGELDSTYGCLFIGVLISAILFGITNLQTFIYFQWYPHDNIWTKSAVSSLWLLDAVHLVLCSHMLYHYLVSDIFQPLKRQDIVWSFKAEMIVVIFITIFVQTLYAIRIWVLAGLLQSIQGSRVRIVLRSSVSVFVCIAYGVAIVMAYEIMKFDSWAALFLPKHLWITFVPSSIATAVDIVITASMCFLLYRCRTGLGPTDSMINSLMLFTVNTGMVTAFCSILNIVITAALPKSFGMLSVGVVLGKFYVNCFLAMLNARKTLHSHDSTEINPSSLGSVTLRFRAPAHSPSQYLSSLPPVFVGDRYKADLDASFDASRWDSLHHGARDSEL